MELLLFYSELGKLSVEYLQFNTITNIEYVRIIHQDNLFISIVLQIFEDDFEYIRNYHGIETYSNINYKDDPERKCLSNYGLTSFMHYKYSLLDRDNMNYDNDELAKILFICNNITLDHIIDRSFFYYKYMSDGIDIRFNQFINSSRFSIGYSVSQKAKDDSFPFQPVLTYQLNNVLYDQDNIFVSIFL